MNTDLNETKGTQRDITSDMATIEEQRFKKWYFRGNCDHLRHDSSYYDYISIQIHYEPTNATSMSV